jgi:hypothetical protein
MNKRIVYFIITVCLTATVIWLLYNSFNRPKIKLETAVKSSIESPEDPQARFNYLFNKQKNPVTGQIPDNIRPRELAFAAKLPVRSDLLLAGKESLAKNGETMGYQWTRRGPYNLGGRTRALAVDISNENVILAAGVSGGMWRSVNSGLSWVRTTTSDQLLSATCIAQDTRAGKTSTWYYGTGEYRGNTASGEGGAFFVGDGIFKSTNGGQSWTLLPATRSNSPQTFNLGFDIVWNVAIDPSNTSQDEVYAATYGRIYRSINGGTNWTPVFTVSDPNSARYTDISVSSTGVVYITISSGEAASQGIWRSTTGDLGSWTKITPAGWPSTYRRVVLAIAPSNENIVYFLADTPGSGISDHSLWRYQYLSGDGSGSGGSWSDRTANIPADGGSTGDFSSQSSYDLIIKVKPDNENVVFIGGTNLYRSDDGFATGNQITWIGGYVNSNDSYNEYPNHHPDQHSLAFYPSNPKKMLSGHDGGISFTYDATASNVTWSLLNNGYYTAQFYTVAIDYSKSGDNLILGGMQDNGTYRLNAAISTAYWDAMLGGDGGFCAISSNSNYYYVSVQNGQTYRLKGNNPIYDWARVDPTGGSDYLFINPFVLDRNNTNIMYMAANDVIYRNTNLTAITQYNSDPTDINWSELTETKLTSGGISALESSKNPSYRLYYGTTNGRVYKLDPANTGSSLPVNITSNNFPAGYVSCVSANPDNADNVMAVFSNYEVISIWFSSDAGSTWQNVSGNLEENTDGSGSGPSVNWAEILPVSDGTLYLVGTSTGVYSTTSLNGLSTEWEQEGPSTIGNAVVDMIDSRTTDGLVVVGTHGNGVFSTNVVSSLEEQPELTPDDFKLSQNYPNPFNPETTIKYQISKSGEVTLKVFDIQGREVVTLVNSNQIAGHYSVNWNGQDRFGIPVASGTYICRLTAGQHMESKQMQLIR